MKILCSKNRAYLFNLSLSLSISSELQSMGNKFSSTFVWDVISMHFPILIYNVKYLASRTYIYVFDNISHLLNKFCYFIHPGLSLELCNKELARSSLTNSAYCVFQVCTQTFSYKTVLSWRKKNSFEYWRRCDESMMLRE